MKKRLKSALLAVLVLALAIVAVGCGGSESKETGKEESATKTKLIVGAEPTFAPFEFKDTKTGQYTGFDLDLMNALCEEAGYEMDFQSIAFQGLIAALQGGQIDAAASAMTINEERKQAVNFTDPYYKSGLIVAIKADNNEIKGFEDLKGKKIAVQIGTTGAMQAQKVEGAKVSQFDTNDLAFLELKNGNVDAVINDYPVAAYFIKQGNEDVKMVGEILSAEEYGIAVPKSKPEVLEKLNTALKTLKENGKYDEIYKKWFGEQVK